MDRGCNYLEEPEFANDPHSKIRGKKRRGTFPWRTTLQGVWHWRGVRRRWATATPAPSSPPGRSLLVVGAGLGPQVLFSTSQAISGLFNQPNPTGGPMSLVRGSHPNLLFWTLLASKATRRCFSWAVLRWLGDLFSEMKGRVLVATVHLDGYPPRGLKVWPPPLAET